MDKEEGGGEVYHIILNFFCVEQFSLIRIEVFFEIKFQTLWWLVLTCVSHDVR